MRKELFFTSDIHGYYDELIACLKRSGFNEDNEKHLLVVLGDCFDRGPKSKEVYEYLSRLEDKGRCVITAGNHDKFLIDFLEHEDKSDWGNSIAFNYTNNGLNETIASFLDRTLPFESWCLIDDGCEINGVNFNRWVDVARHEILKDNPNLLVWLKSRPRYFESENYIGVHGAIDTNVRDWHYPKHTRYNLKGWDALDFDNGMFFSRDLGANTRHHDINKTIVIGHFGTRELRRMHSEFCKNDNPKDINDILIRDDGRIVALDATTVLSHKVNIYKVTDDINVKEVDGKDFI